MTLKEFLTKYQLSLFPPVLHACQEAIRRMNLSRDPFHDTSHISRILSNLDQFLSENRELSVSKINFSVLLLAICWHDVWKSSQSFASRKKTLFNELYEGVGSMRVFSKSSNGFSLPPDIIRKTKYAIRKHSTFQLFPKRTLESKILYDLDSLEVWTFDRVKNALAKMGGIDHLGPSLIRVGKFYFQHWMMKKTGKNLFFTWTRREFLLRKAKFYEEGYAFASTIKWLSLPSWLTKNPATTLKTAKSSSKAPPE